MQIDDPFSPAAQPTGTVFPPDGIPWARPIPAMPLQGADGPMQLRNESPAQAWADIVTFLMLLLFADFLVGMVVGGVTMWRMGIEGAQMEENQSAVEKAMLVPVVVSRATAAVFLVWLFLKARGQSFAAVGLTKRGIGVDIALGIVTLCIVYGMAYPIMLILAFLFPKVFEQFQENSEALMEMVPRLRPLAFVPFALVIGFYEELIFRGFLLPRLRRGTRSWVLAVLLSTGLFTLPHLGDQTGAAMIAISLLGLIFAILTIWRRSILPAVTAHFLFDLSQFYLLYVTSGERWK